MAITKDIYNSPTVKESIKIAKNNAEIDAHIGLEQLYQEALENGFKGSKDDFIRTAPLKVLRQIMKNGGETFKKQTIIKRDLGLTKNNFVNLILC